MRYENFSLAQCTSYKIGGSARYFFDAENVDEVKETLRFARARRLKVFVLGGGTNLLMGDKGFDGVVLRPRITFLKAEGEKVHVGAGVLMSELLDFTVKKGLSGLEWAGGLPGMVGGAIRGNAGAFGGETKDVVERVRSIELQTLKEIERDNTECGFAYRSSVFKEGDVKEVILSVLFQLQRGDRKKVKFSINEKIDYRNSRHPMEYPNVGSVFKNIAVKQLTPHYRKEWARVIKTDPFPVVPTAHVISLANLKGVSLGGAMISPKHPNFIVNVLGATAEDVKALIALVKDGVRKKFGIELEPEVTEV